MSEADQVFGFVLTETEGGAVVYMRFDDADLDDVYGCPACSTPVLFVELLRQRPGGTDYVCRLCKSAFPIWRSDPESSAAL